MVKKLEEKNNLKKTRDKNMMCEAWLFSRPEENILTRTKSRAYPIKFITLRDKQLPRMTPIKR